MCLFPELLHLPLPLCARSYTKRKPASQGTVWRQADGHSHQEKYISIPDSPYNSAVSKAIYSLFDILFDAISLIINE
jgi:hypothetical protein